MALRESIRKIVEAEISAWVESHVGHSVPDGVDPVAHLAAAIRAGTYRGAPATDTIGARIQAARKAAGLSCAALALAVSVQRMQVYRWEDNLATPSHDRLRVIAKALNVPVGKLIPT